MHEPISQSDWERIREFANTPMYKRDPEMLVPPRDTDEGVK